MTSVYVAEGHWYLVVELPPEDWPRMTKTLPLDPTKAREYFALKDWFRKRKS